MKKFVAITLILLGYLLVMYGYWQNKRNQVIPTQVRETPSLYEITLECQKLAAESMDKYRMEEKDGKKVMTTFGYESCLKELKKAVNDGQTIQML